MSGLISSSPNSHFVYTPYYTHHGQCDCADLRAYVPNETGGRGLWEDNHLQEGRKPVATISQYQGHELRKAATGAY